MANLLIDLGNSNCKAAFHSNGELVCVYKDTGEDLEQFLNFLDIQWKEKFGEEKIDVIVFSNVREENAKIENLLNLKCRELVVLNEHTRLPKTLTYAFCPTGLGGDRLAGALAVSMLFPNEDCLKFDFGTALTIDFIDKEGFYAGGNISLGLQTRLKALNTFTKRLPLITPNKEFDDKHAHLNIFPDAVVEVHWWPSVSPNPFLRKRLEEYYTQVSQLQWQNKVQLFSGEIINATDSCFDAVYTLLHIYNHFII